ncbi:MAG: hypothetical protein EOO73_02260 [Myxococcales bacterium]|nr:MAG: hypothetical protein EOO73_02260 [Myxococcales bacterium]
MKRAAAYLLACVALLSSVVAEARLLSGVNVAALAVAGERLYVGGFDQGLFVLEEGREPRRLEAPGLSPYINALAWSAAEQELWVGTARGLLRCRHGVALSCRRLGPSRAVHALLLRAGGEVVAGGDDGLIFVRGEHARLFGKKQQAPFRAVWALAEGAEHLYVGATNGLFWGREDDFHAGGRLSRASVVQGSLLDDWVTALLSQGGALYVGTYSGGVARLVTVDGKLSPESTSALGHVNPAGVVALSGEGLAVCSMEGLWKVSPRFRSGVPSHTPAFAEDVTAVVRAGGEQERSPSRYWLGTRSGVELVLN